MSKKEIKLHMGFLDENGCMIEIPDNIQKLIDAREEYWFNKMKDIDNACGKLLEKLDKQWFQIQADANHIEYLEKENKRLSKNLKLSRKQKEKYYNTFVIAKLEKVKKLLDGYKWFQGENEYSFIYDYAVNWSDVIKIFDQQIKVLKGEK